MINCLKAEMSPNMQILSAAEIEAEKAVIHQQQSRIAELYSLAELIVNKTT
jgi:hypothetical protein